MVNVEVTLEELFNGTTRTLKLQKRKVVDKRMVLEVKPLEVSTPIFQGTPTGNGSLSLCLCAACPSL